MASFIGTKEEFKRYIGPMLRNLVQQITRKYKTEIGSCQHCGTTDTLEAAHIHGRGRGTIIDNIIDEYTTNNTITINLTDFEKLFRDEHQNISETIIILCKACHSKYDATPLEAEQANTVEPTVATNSIKPMVQIKLKDKPKSRRLFSNQEIQQRISQIARSLTTEELDKLCSPYESKDIFGINFPLFIKTPKNITGASKRSLVKDEAGINRWTWKYEFEKNDFLYAITTQWYEKNDSNVKQWLHKHED